MNPSIGIVIQEEKRLPIKNNHDSNFITNICPYFFEVGFFLNNPIRKFFQNPEKILGRYVRDGMTVIETDAILAF